MGRTNTNRANAMQPYEMLPHVEQPHAAPSQATRPHADIMDETRLASLILTNDTTATPQRIIESITSLAASNILTEGQRLPTVRRLASRLRVSPATVSSAYHALSRAGILHSRGRAGTFILPQSNGMEPPPPHAADRHDGPLIDLSKGTPDLTLLPDIRPFLSTLGKRKAFVNSYDGPTILPMLERMLRRNWPYDPQAMTMVSGAGDALAAAMDAFTRPGDVVAVETPTYPVILDMIAAHGATAVGIAMDGDGMRPDLLRNALERWHIRMLVVQPRAQNPTGASLSPERVDELADVLAAGAARQVASSAASNAAGKAASKQTESGETGADGTGPIGAATDGMPLIVEDDHSGDVANAHAVSLAARLPDHVLHIHSFSKSHGPDLRLAAVSGTRRDVDAIIAIRRLGPGWVSRFLQEILVEMLADKQTFRTVLNARHVYATRQKTMHELLLRHGLDVPMGEGLNLWLPVRDEAAAMDWLERHHIRVAAGAPFRPAVEAGPVEPVGRQGSVQGPVGQQSRSRKTAQAGVRVTIATPQAVSEHVAGLLAQAAVATPTDKQTH